MHHNPAASYDFGTWLWGMAEPICQAADYASRVADLIHLDEQTAQLGWDRVNASWETEFGHMIGLEHPHYEPMFERNRSLEHDVYGDF